MLQDKERAIKKEISNNPYNEALKILKEEKKKELQNQYSPYVNYQPYE